MHSSRLNAAIAGMLLTATAQLAFGQVASAATAQTEAAKAVDSGSDVDRDWWGGDIWREQDRGFNWYPPDRQLKAKPKKNEAKPAEAESIAQPRKKSIREMTTFAEVDKEMKRLRELAVFQPTQQNVLTYLRAQEYVLSKSSLFADTARRVVWQNPDVDYNNRNPVANYSQMSKKERMESTRSSVLADVAKTHGIVFFLRSDCPYCHDMAPVLRAMQNQYGIEIMAVTMDGGGLPAFPNPKRDNGISKFVSNGEGITTVPALYLVANDAKTVTALGTGALAMDEIIERIRVLMTTKPGQEF
jgi:conjugal transfer pilus assembly protein TraF